MILQGTPDWHALRIGKVTASRMADVLMKPDTAGFQNYRAQLVCERLTGRPVDSFTSAAMQAGTEREPQARAIYTMEAGQMVQEVAFIDHPTIAMAGCSPDGLVGETGLIEIKCPQPAEHIRTITGGTIKRQYVLQMQWQMACTGREWCDFVSFCPDMPDELAVHVERVLQNAEQVQAMEKAVREFLDDVSALLLMLQQKVAK